MAEITVRTTSVPFSRMLFPAGIALCIWGLLNVATSHLGWFGSGHSYRTAANILYPLLGITIIFSSVAVYSVMYSQGSSTKARILLSLLVPFAWILKEIWRVSAFFSTGESIYYGLAPNGLGLLVGETGILCLCELFWRWQDKKSGKSLRIVTAGPLFGLLIMAIMTYFMFFWGSSNDTPGSKWFYLYMEGYKALFVR